ncbi:hypothetical protein [Klebsiella pneumoniae]|uniref:hypothetical protein n=1 Tax=Klebsiella pneumoniae TaxID=573 RepID=UPI0022B6E256|nr:hypothetical protein [Klebsiella pneumoniae]
MKQTGRTKTFYAREAILAHLEDPGGLLSFSRNCCTRSPVVMKQCISSEDVVKVTWSGRLTIPDLGAQIVTQDGQKQNAMTGLRGFYEFTHCSCCRSSPVREAVKGEAMKFGAIGWEIIAFCVEIRDDELVILPPRLTSPRSLRLKLRHAAFF